jgi:hypothetical protein
MRFSGGNDSFYSTGLRLRELMWGSELDAAGVFCAMRMARRINVALQVDRVLHEGNKEA